MAQLPSSMRDKYMNSDFNQDIAAFHARKGRLPTVLEINRDPNLRKWQDELSAEFKGRDPDPVIGYAYAGYPYASAAPAPGCREKCDICKSQWLVGLPMEITGYDISYTDLEARDQLDHARHIAHQDYLHICKHLENYGDVFVKRWQKRNASKRADLLRKALPDMYARRGFPLVEYLNVRPGQTGETLEERQDRLRTAELLPYLNIDALAESPLEVLALLHRRITDAPRQWSAFDYHQHESSFKTGMVRSSYNPHCVAMSTKRFGCLTLFEKRGIHDASLISFPRAKLLFDAQTRLYSFLRALVDLLLGPGISDIEPTGRDELDRLADAQFSDRLGWTADRPTHNSPFSTPPQFDVATIVEQFKLRLQAAEDELELLQTDPACLREQLARAEGSAALSGTSAVKRLSELAELIVVGLQKHDNWRYLLSETEVAAKSIGNRCETLFDDQCLPKDYDNALGIFEHALGTQFKAQQDHLTTLLVASKDFKKFFTKRDDGQFVVDEQLRKLSKGDPLF